MRVFNLNQFIIVALLLSTGCSSSIPLRPEEIKREDPQFTPPSIEQWTTKNGLQVYLLEDHELPLFSGEFYFKFGSLTEADLPKGQIEAMMSQLRAGGIAGSTPQQLDTELDAVGASIEGASGGEFSTISFFSHKSDSELIFSKLKGLIRQPAYDPARLAIWKSQATDSIDRRREDPESIANATFATALYGDKSIYSALPTKASIAEITSEKLRALSHNKILPDGASLSVTGDVTRAELEVLLEKYLGGWEGKAEVKEVAAAPNFVPKPGLYFVDSNFQQSAVIIGQAGPARLSKDQFSLSVFNRYFSRGAFGSVLFTEVRSKRGFAYSVDGGFSPGAKTGEFSIDMGTRAEVTEPAVAEVINQINLARNQTPPASKIDDVKAAVKQGFIFNFAKPSSALTREVMLNLLGYPKDFNQTYISNISAVSPEQVRQTAFERLTPDNLIVVVVGKLDGKSLAKSLNLPFYRVEFSTYPKVLK
jgi:zinc protease